MKWINCSSKLSPLCLVAAIFAMTTDAEATTALSSWDTQSNPTCGNIFGSGVSEKKDTSVSGGSNTINLPGGGEITYFVDTALPGLTNWNSTEPWDAVILRNASGSTVFVYGAAPPAQPTTSDTDLAGRTPTQVAFCKGVSLLETDPLQEPEPDEPLPSCDEEGVLTHIDSALCTELGTEPGTIVTTFTPGGQMQQCECVSEQPSPWAVCDEGTDNGDENVLFCYDKDDEPQNQPTIIVEFDPDPKTCTTINGKRTCSKCLDNPFTEDVDECAPTAE